MTFSSHSIMTYSTSVACDWQDAQKDSSHLLAAGLFRTCRHNSMSRCGSRAPSHSASCVWQDIEEDPSRLLATGLFRSCRPVVTPPQRGGEFYPTFLQHQAPPSADEQSHSKDAADATGEARESEWRKKAGCIQIAMSGSYTDMYSDNHNVAKMASLTHAAHTCGHGSDHEVLCMFAHMCVGALSVRQRVLW